MKPKNYKKKNDLNKINEFLNQRIEKSKNFKNRFFYLTNKRSTQVHKIRKNPKRGDIKNVLKKELNNY